MKYDVLHGDVIEKLQEIPDNTFDALLSDPPYSLNFMGLDWDRAIPGVDVWGEVLRTMKPGAFGLVFGGTRTFHRLAVAMEDAGFELRDTLMWVYGSGFPKSHDVSKAIDKLAGAERQVVGSYEVTGTAAKDGRQGRASVSAEGGNSEGLRRTLDITAPATAAAAQWEGYGTALKPAWESVLLVRKPTKLTYAKNVLEHGTGALNIDGARIPTEDKLSGGHATGGQQMDGGWRRPWMDDPEAVAANAARSQASVAKSETLGRWPANVLHDGSDEVVSHFPHTKSGKPGTMRLGENRSAAYGAESRPPGTPMTGFGDEGSAARFYYAAKSSPKERSAGLDERCKHPTMKPIALTEYLAKLLLPPTDDAHLLVPYSGSGSELIGALRAGWPQATGIEIGEEWVATSMKRLAHFADGGEA